MSDAGVPERYVELGLRLGRHVDGLVDAYYGDPHIAQRAESEPLRDPSDLVEDARRLIGELDDDGLGEQRRRWLRAQVTGLETTARKLSGEEIPYTDEVERCYGVRPRRVPEEEFEEAHRALDEALPGPGSLADRYQGWRERDPLPPDILPSVLEAIASELRRLTAELVGLPEGETAELDFVTDEPWWAYNYYLGGLRSRIAINTDVPMVAAFATALVAHEIYPGHHTEHAFKEQLLVRERGQVEETVQMIGTPQSLISEAIAELAVEIVLEDEDAFAAELLGRFGIEYAAERGRAVRGAHKRLAAVAANAALLLYEDGGSPEDAHGYLRTWSLASERRADQAMRFIADPLWRSYVTTYTDGYALGCDWVAADPARFQRLVTEQLTPADLL